MNLIPLILAFALSWHDTAVPPCTAFRVYRDGVQIASVADTAFVDSTASLGVRHGYYVVGVRDGKASQMTAPVTGLELDWTQGVTDTLRYSRWHAPALLYLRLPRSRWEVNWSLGSSEHVVAHCDYDLDFDNGAVDLSDLVFFAGLPGKRTAEECKQMRNVYWKQARREHGR